MTWRCALLRALVIGAFALEGMSAQSLGDVARKEQERRKQTPPGKQYTNDNLRSEPKPSAPDAVRPIAGAPAKAADAAKPTPVEAPSASSSAAENASAPLVREKRDETHWRTRARELRGRVQQTRDEIASVEVRLADLDAQSGASVARERDVTAGALSKLRQNLQFFLAEVDRFEQRARSEKVPADWIK